MNTPADTQRTSKAGRNLPAAIGVGVALFVVTAVGLIWLPWLFAAMMALGLVLSTVEVHRALLRKGMRAEIVPIAVGTGVSVLGGFAVSRFDVYVTPIVFVVSCLGATMLAVLTSRLRRGVEGFLLDAAASALIIAYIPLLGVFVPLMMAAPLGTMRVLVVIICVILADTGAYATGVLFGRHKMAPSISPAKTWEGFAGAVVFSMVGGAIAVPLLLGADWWVGLILGALLCPAATLGDLVESLIKRDAGIKDMSNFLPGHGGVMDRLDSMLVAVPVGWLVLHLALGG
ncbi:phosphatidate cytidylyltransferase [Tessaracoccus defluvii]|uniref:Phosphatidate cytidylyltransferase n=1 Tax=Tessaracoccus defluvii TaxID=1285901 RepID=A0A7H0H7J6_9ACTN|nr:phosphatidate cytidylyltransferase [Tessaracoccus defluvii]QNP56512.1 phosphatidate cytidylyltransferase [Tessaracoccus defluvii]